MTRVSKTDDPGQSAQPPCTQPTVHSTTLSYRYLCNGKVLALLHLHPPPQASPERFEQSEESNDGDFISATPYHHLNLAWMDLGAFSSRVSAWDLPQPPTLSKACNCCEEEIAFSSWLFQSERAHRQRI